MTIPLIRPPMEPVLRIDEHTPVFPVYAETPSAASLPLFGDEVWDLRVLRVRLNHPLSGLVIDFRLFTDPIRRLVAKEYLYARLNFIHPPYRRLAVTNVKKEYYEL